MINLIVYILCIAADGHASSSTVRCAYMLTLPFQHANTYAGCGTPVELLADTPSKHYVVSLTKARPDVLMTVTPSSFLEATHEAEATSRAEEDAWD